MGGQPRGTIDAFVASARAAGRIVVCSTQSRTGAGVGGCESPELQCGWGINPQASAASSSF